MIDTHAHLYQPEFEEDLPDVIRHAQSSGVKEIWLPSVDVESLQAMETLRPHPLFRFFAGLHPCEVKADFREQLQKVRSILDTHPYEGIGEIGIDLYWDQTFVEEQKEALLIQFEWALERNQPVLIHVRDGFDTILPLVRPFYRRGLKGIFHSFGGSLDQALELTTEGRFLLGINGVITYKNSTVAPFLSQIPLSHIVTETDSPYLPPVPFRGKRNESRHIPLIVAKLAEIYNLTPAEIAEQTTRNARILLGK